MPRPASAQNPSAAKSFPNRSGVGEKSRPGAADVARHLGLIVHDLRGPTTALHAYSRLLDEHARPGLDPQSATWLDAFQANAELTGHLCDALCILEGTSLRSGGPIRDIVVQAMGRLQKLLARGPLLLKVSGEFPDRRSERRRLGFVVEALMVSAAGESGAGRPATFDWSASEREERIVLTLRFQPGLFEALADLPVRLRAGHPAGLSELALAAALSDLDARLEAPARGTLEVLLPIGSDVSWP